MATALNEILSKGRLQVSGIRKNVAILGVRGMNEEYADKLDALVKDVENLDNEQESLKAQLKTKTDELQKKQAELKAAIAKNSHIIKAEVPKTQWIEFGITAKQ
jgi:Skp family chaperone for outer membrane proteins